MSSQPDHTQTPEYREAVRRAADQITLSEGQRAQLAILLRPRPLLATAVSRRPDLPVAIAREVVGDAAP